MTKILIGSGNETTILRSQHDLDQARDLLGVTHQRINYETGRLLAEPKALGIGSVVNLGAEFMQGGTAHGLIGGVCAPSQRERRCCSGGVTQENVTATDHPAREHQEHHRGGRATPASIRRWR